MSGINYMTNYNSNSMKGRPMAVQENRSELDLLFLVWLRTSFVVRSDCLRQREAIKGQALGTAGVQSLSRSKLFC